MTWFDHSRRAATVVLVALVVMLVPAVAQATFSANRAAGLDVATDQLQTPTGITGTYRCVKSGSTESMTVTVSGFSDAGPGGATYAYRLLDGTIVRDTASTAARSTTLSGSRSNDRASTTWTVSIQPTLSRWTGPVGTVSVTCPPGANGSGAL